MSGYNSEIVGNWQGNLTVGTIKMPLTFIIKKDNKENLDVSLLSQGRKVPANLIKFRENQLQVEFSNIGGKFEGEFQKSSQTIPGKWYQGGQIFDIVLDEPLIVLFVSV